MQNRTRHGEHSWSSFSSAISSSTLLGMQHFVKIFSKKLSKDMPEDKVADFQKEAAAAVGYLKKNFKELQFFMGPSNDPAGTLVFAMYAEGAEAPVMMYFKWGLKEEKV